MAQMLISSVCSVDNVYVYLLHVVELIHCRRLILSFRTECDPQTDHMFVIMFSCSRVFLLFYALELFLQFAVFCVGLIAD